MPQIHHQQFGIFHLVTKTFDNVPWCTRKDVPQRLIEHLCLSRDVHGALLHAFCILPNHVHLILCPGSKGISSFMQTFKSNSAKDIRRRLRQRIGWQAGFYDERIRSDKQRSNAVGYVLGNAMKHRLVNDVIEWPWTSLHFPSVCDPMGLW